MPSHSRSSSNGIFGGLVATALVLLVLRVIDSRRWASRFRQDESSAPMPTKGAADDHHGRTGEEHS